MAVRLLENRGRGVGVAGAVALHLAVIAALLFLAPGPPSVPARQAILVVVDVAPPPPPPPPPPPNDAKQGAAAPPSRGDTAAPSQPRIARLLPPSLPVAPSADAGPHEGTGRGPAVGSAAGHGGEGSGSGSGTDGTGGGASVVTPPVHIAGALTNADYRAAGAPRGAAGTVRVSFRVRSDGSVDRCIVVGPSGYPPFDEATCRLIEQRFRFRPAADDTGAPVEWTIRTDYTWAPRSSQETEPDRGFRRNR